MCTKRLKFFNQKQIYFLPCFQKKKKKHNCLFFPSLPYFSPHRLAAEKEGKILRDATRAEIDMTIFRTDAHSKPMINAFTRYVYTRKRSYFTSWRKWVRLHRGTCIELRDEWMLWKERERERTKEGGDSRKRTKESTLEFDFVPGYLNAANEKNIYNSFRKFAQLGITLNNIEIFCEIHFCE